MITYAIIATLNAVFSALLSWLPDVESLPGGIDVVLAQLGPVTTNINVFFPLDSFAIMVGLFIVIESTIFAFRFVKWILKTLRGSG